MTTTEMQGMVIDVKQAKIDTATIEIRTLHVSGKQLTLAVFRQLDNKFPDEGSTPIIWGRVNYHPDDCKNEGTHLHIVWQRERALYRATVYENGHPVGANYRSGSLPYPDELDDPAFHYSAIRKLPVEAVQPNTTWPDCGRRVIFPRTTEYKFSGHGLTERVCRLCPRTLDDKSLGLHVVNREYPVTEPYRLIDEQIDLIAVPTDREREVWKRIDAGMDEVLRVKAWRLQLWESALSARHLFIAV